MGSIAMTTTSNEDICFISCISYSIFFTLAIFIIAILNIRLFFKATITLPFIIKILSYITNMSGLIGSILLVYKILYHHISKQSLRSPNMMLNRIMAGFCINVILPVSIYITFLIRLKLAFSNSVYTISRLTWFILITLITSYVGLYTFILWALSPVGNLSRTHFVQTLDNVNYAITAINSVLNILMMFIFNLLLFKLINSIRSSIYSKKNQIDNEKNKKSLSMESNQSTEINTRSTFMTTMNSFSMSSMSSKACAPENFYNDKQERLIFVVVKITILCSISMIANFIMQLLLINVNTDGCSGIVLRTLQIFYAFVEIMCVFLNFVQNGWWYRKLCAGFIGCCDELCKCVNYWAVTLKERREESKMANSNTVEMVDL